MDIKKIIEKLEDEGSSINLADLVKAIQCAKETNSPELAYKIAEIEDTQRAQMEKIVLKAKNPKYCALFATDIPGANVELHKKIIFGSKDTESICYFMSRVEPKKQDILKAEEIIKDKKDAKAAYEFYAGVEGASYEFLSQVAIDAKDIDSLEKFKNVEYTNKTKVNLALGRQKKVMQRVKESEEMTK